MLSQRTVIPMNADWTFRFANKFSGKGERVDLPHT